MAKRLFAWVLVLALVFSLVPAISVGVSAADDHQHTDHTGWTAWSDGTKLPTGAGKYYLTVDVALTAAWSPAAGHTQLCLNGHTVTQKTANARMVVVNANRELSIYDCAPAYNAANEYIGGKFQGGNNSNNGLFIVARGSASAARGTLNLYGGRICGNRLVNDTAVGGAVYLQSGQAKKPGGLFNMYGGEITDNQAKYGGAVSLHGESAASRGDVPATFNMYGGKIFGNNTTTGTIYGLNDVAVNLLGGEITENTASSGSCLYMKGDVQVMIKDMTITKNTATNASSEGNGSAVFLGGLAAKLTLGGKLTITGNTNHANGCDITLNNDAGGNVEKVYVDGLTEGAVRFTVIDTAVSEAYEVVDFVGDNKAYTDGVLVFVEGTKEKAVNLVENQFLFEGSPAAVSHKHTLCNETGCTSHGEEISFKAWTKTTTLPTEGNYYLTGNVTLTAAATVTSSLNLCLNGFTVTQATAGQRVLNVGNASAACTVSLTDCGTTGKLTGGTATYGTCVSIRHKATFNLYGGTLTGNAKTGSGAEGTVYMQGNTPTENTFNMYGGAITGNTARVGGAISVGAPAASITKIPQVNIYGGTISGNTAQVTGGGIHLSGRAKLRLENVTITENTAPKGAGIYMATEGSTITLAGAPQIFGNTADGLANNLVLPGNQLITLEKLDETAKVYVSADKLGRAISTQCDTDYSANILSDSSAKTVTYKDNALWIEEYSDHQHCICEGRNIGTCDHTVQMWIAWGDDDNEKTSLPSASGYYYLVSDIQMAAFVNPPLNQEIYLCLNGKTVTAAENDRHMNVSDGTVLTITDCNAQVGGFTGGNRTFGGSININAGGTMNLYAGRFFENTAPDSEGGALYLQSGRAADGGVLNMYGGSVEKNTALYGGGIRAAGLNAGATKQPSIVNIYGGTITGNKVLQKIVTDENGKQTVTNSAGGGISTQGGTILNIYGGTITKNSSEYDGGGIYTKQSTVTIDGADIVENTAANNGGGLFDAMSTMELKKGNISGNQAGNRGGAFVASGSVMDIYEVTIAENSAKEGGVTYMNRSSVKSNNVVTYYPALVTVHEGAVVTGNKGQTNTGGFLVANPDVKLVIAGGEITKNTAANGGAFMIWKGATILMTGGKIANNDVGLGIGGGGYVSNDATFIMEGGTITGNKARLGSGLYGDRAVLELKGGAITGNYAKIKYTYKDGKETKSGGQGAGVYIQGCVLKLSGTSISYNQAESSGCGVVISSQSVKTNGVTTVIRSQFTMTGGSISYNTSKAAAGGLLVQSTGTVANIYGGTIAGNKSANTGGGIYVSTKATLNMYGGSVLNNHSEKVGGGFFVSQGTLNMSNVTVRGNTALTNGAGMVINGDKTVVTAKNCKFSDNTTKSGGAVVIQSKGRLVATDCDFYDNDAHTGNGGAVYVASRSFADLKNCKFWGNHSSATGGAVYVANFSVADLEGCDFTENATDGTGGALSGFPASKTEIRSTTFNKNTADTKGGAIFCRGDITLTDSLIENCSATEDGGGISADVNTVAGSGFMRGLVLDGTTIRNNSTNGKGGGIYGYKGCRVELHNSTITGNTAGDNGGAVWAYEDLELHNTQITGNTSGGDGYAVYMNDANFDGHSYMASKNKLSGDTVIRDNVGGNLYMGPDVVIAITGDGLGQNAYIDLELDSGVVTHRIIGAYHYEGGNQAYIVTYGDRSWTDPETDPTIAAQTQQEQADNAAKTDVLLYVAIGVVAVAAIAAAAVIILKKKKPAAAEKN